MASSIRNIGPISGRWLAAIGVESIHDLERVGAVEAYRRVREQQPGKVSLSLLWALQGALMELHFAEVPDEIKRMLLARLGESDG